eukprot:Skav230902  [mRNA]  locus=scaffold3693:13101:13569:+ [translate_table: standard]
MAAVQRSNQKSTVGVQKPARLPLLDLFQSLFDLCELCLTTIVHMVQDLEDLRRFMSQAGNVNGTSRTVELHQSIRKLIDVNQTAVVVVNQRPELLS